MAGPEILLTGSSGLIGTLVVRALKQNRISTISLLRGEKEKSSDGADRSYLWNPASATPMPDPSVLDGVTGAVHLAGANLSGQRWTPAYKQEILESRTKPTEALARLLAQRTPKPEVLVSASAVGIYGDRGAEVLTENSSVRSDFLAEVCQAWEKAAQPARDAGIRVVHLRFGVVLSPRGGALAKMLPIFRAGLGGRLGDGRQWMSWAMIADVVRAIEFALEETDLAGSFNVAAPNPVTNAEFTRVLGSVLHRPTLFPVPKFALRLAFGEMAESTVLASQRAIPERLSSAGFRFRYPELAAGLKDALSAEK